MGNNPGWAVDAIIVGFLLLQTFLGWRRGLLWQAAGVASVGFGIALGQVLAPSIGALLLDHFTSSPFKAKLIAYLLVLAVVGFMLRMAAAVAETHAERGLPKEERNLRRADDRILGGIFGALKGLILALVLVTVGVTMYPKSSAWRESSLAQPLAVAGSRLLPEGAVGEVKQWVSRSAVNVSQGLDIKADSITARVDDDQR